MSTIPTVSTLEWSACRLLLVKCSKVAIYFPESHSFTRLRASFVVASCWLGDSK